MKNFLKALGRFFSILFLIILIPYFIISIVLTYSAITNLDNLPSVFGYKPVIIKNNLMKNDLYKGDLLIVKTQETYSLLKKEDIITYKESTNHYKTRKINTIVKSPEVDENTSMEDLDPAEYRLIASSKEKEDSGSIMSNQIEGVYFLKIPMLGTVLSYIENRWILIASLPILALLIILFIKLAVKCAPKKVEEEQTQKEDLELMSAAELTTGVNMRDKLLKDKTKQNNSNVAVGSQPQPQQPQQPQVQIIPQQPQVQPQPQQQQAPQPQIPVQNTGGDFGGGIRIIPPTEQQINQQPLQSQNTVTNNQPQIQIVPPTETPQPQTPFTNSQPVQQPPQQPQAVPQQPQVTVIPQNKN